MFSSPTLIRILKTLTVSVTASGTAIDMSGIQLPALAKVLFTFEPDRANAVYLRQAADSSTKQQYIPPSAADLPALSTMPMLFSTCPKFLYAGTTTSIKLTIWEVQ